MKPALPSVLFATLCLAACGPGTSIDAGSDAAPDTAADAPLDTQAPLEAGPDAVVSEAGSCTNTGTVTTPTPATSASPTSDFNITALACTRTAAALACELGVAHQVSFVVEGTVRRLRGNGIPNHDVGPFPNPGNPNSIAAQNYDYRVPVTPSGAGAAARVFGLTTSGAVLDPGTAELWNDDPNWVYEAMRYATGAGYFSGPSATDRTRHPMALGLDCNFAHVQPGGAYHYHGIPSGLMPAAPAVTFVGWAGDGYPIYARWGFTTAADPTSAVRELRSSYRIKSGARPSGTEGPGGTYDGTFARDWEYAAGTGDLDECNGRTGMVPLEGRMTSTYHYVLTDTYPYIPRCFHAAPDASFSVMGMGMGMGMMMRACTATSECTGACPMSTHGCACGTTPMGRMCVPGCTVARDCPPGMGGMALQCRDGACVP